MLAMVTADRLTAGIRREPEADCDVCRRPSPDSLGETEPVRGKTKGLREGLRGLKRSAMEEAGGRGEEGRAGGVEEAEGSVGCGVR